MLIKMAPNQTECTWFDQKYVISSSVAENCKPREILRIISEVYGGVGFNRKCLKMVYAFSTKIFSRKHGPCSGNTLTIH